MSEETASLRIRIEGLVQGVGFRAFILREGEALRLRGWVRNRSDGTVEVLASGPQKDIETLVARCMRGPAGARVGNVELAKAEPPERAGFTLRPTL